MEASGMLSLVVDRPNLRRESRILARHSRQAEEVGVGKLSFWRASYRRINLLLSRAGAQASRAEGESSRYCGSAIDDMQLGED
jgi:hypothetical protein